MVLSAFATCRLLVRQSKAEVMQIFGPKDTHVNVCLCNVGRAMLFLRFSDLQMRCLSSGLEDPQGDTAAHFDYLWEARGSLTYGDTKRSSSPSCCGDIMACTHVCVY